MPTPQLLAFRGEKHPSGTTGFSLALPTYLPGYEHDDWFLVITEIYNGGSTAATAGAPWPGTTLNGLGLNYQSRWYNNDDSPWFSHSHSVPFGGIAYMFAFRNGGQAQNYTMGGGTGDFLDGEGCIQLNRDIVPTLPQDAIAILMGISVLPAELVDGGFQATVPFVDSWVSYDHGQVIATLEEDGNFLVKYTDVQPAGTVYPADVYCPPAFPVFEPANFGVTGHFTCGDTFQFILAHWLWVDFAENPRKPDVTDETDGPPPVGTGCPPNLQATATLGPVRVVTQSPIVIRVDGPVVTASPVG